MFNYEGLSLDSAFYRRLTDYQCRQLHDASDLPGGSFETHFSFAQALTESAKLARQCLLVISLPASDTSGRSHADDVEVGGTRGREALDRLRNVVGRVESSWRPARMACWPWDWRPCSSCGWQPGSTRSTRTR